MSSGKFSVSIMAVLVVMTLVCQMASAANLVASSSAVNGTSTATPVNKPGVPEVAPVAASNNHFNAAAAAHLRVRRKGSGIGGAIAGGVASGAAMTAIGGLLGGRV